jgi:CheY-like chemotaxis protein
MPIVDGLTSTKMIRSFEKDHPTKLLSARASLNGRIPVIAVSASLIERDRQLYIDAGFDGWILKPISFPRVSELLEGIVSPDVRKASLYQPGQWEKGGWFEKAQPSVYAAKTEPAGRIPRSEPSEETKVAAASDDPMAGGVGSKQDVEQERLMETQDLANAKSGRSASMPELGAGKHVYYAAEEDEPVTSPGSL